MGHKVHPFGFRIGIIRDWQSKWYADKHYVEFLQEDLKLRQTIQSKYTGAGISLVEIDHQANEVSVTIYTARPGIVIGRGGQRVDEMRLHLEKLISKRIRLNIREIQQPELDAYLVARIVAEQIEHRVAYRRAMKQAIFRTIQAGAKGIRVSCAGRLGGAEIARRQVIHQGRVPLHTIRADIDYGFTEACTALGRIGVKVWIYKGDILPELKEVEVEESPAELVTTDGVGVEPSTSVKEEAPVQKEKPVKEEPLVEKEAPVQKEEPVKEEPPVEKEAPVQKEKPVKEEPPVEKEAPVQKKEEDVTTKAGEIPQES